MAFVEHNGASIYWHELGLELGQELGQELGKREPIVLGMGLGCSSAMWFRLATRLARRHRVIMLDNRGIGLTEVKYYMVHRITTMAQDIAAVMNAAGVECAHVVGFSMGGMICQQLAIDQPDRVRSLILLGTNCGNPYAVLATPEVRNLLFSHGRLTPQESLQRMRPYVYAQSTPDDRIAEDHVVRLANYPVRRAYNAQLYGMLYWTSYFDLPRLRLPTLVIHGLEDLLVPPQNGRLLAARIPGAELVELASASHFAHTDRPDTIADTVTQFVSRQKSQAA